MKWLMLFLFIILLSSVVVATNVINIHNITKCDGPINIRVVSERGIINNEFIIESCEKINNNDWVCQCDNSFVVNLIPRATTTNKYNIVIEYFLEHFETNNNSLKETLLEGHKRSIRYYNIETKATSVFDFKFQTTTEITTAIVFSTILITVILIIFFFKTKKYTKKDKDYDALNYSSKNLEEMDDILNNIK